MKQIIKVIILVMVALATMLVEAQNAGTASPPAAGPANNAAALRIVSPNSGERLKQDFVNVRFELTNSGVSASGTPNYQLQLDGQEPVTTSATDYTFTGLTPGAHKITVQLVDANNTPVPGARSEVQFFILRPTAGVRQHARMVAAALRVEEPQQPQKDLDGHDLPAAGGALPLLSVIGFGALLGGIASAMKTR